MKTFLKNLSYKLYNLVSFFIPISGNIVLCGAWYGRYADNSKYFFEYLCDSTEFNGRAYYVLKSKKEYLNKTASKSNKSFVYYYSLRMFFLSLRANVYVVSHGIPDVYPFKRKDTTCINLWHASQIKTIGYKSLTEMKWIEELIANNKQLPYDDWDYFLVAHPDLIPFYKDSLKLKYEQFLPFGLPRNSLLYEAKANSSQASLLTKKVKEHFKLGEQDKIILYAPTFREGHVDVAQKYTKKLLEEFESWSKTNDFVLLVRLHPSERFDFLSSASNVYDACEYKDVQELMVATSILITDYNSMLLDYSILDRDIYLYTYDYDDYVSYRGGLYFDYSVDFVDLVQSNKATTILNEISNKKYSKLNHKKYNVNNSLSVLLNKVNSIIDG